MARREGGLGPALVGSVLFHAAVVALMFVGLPKTRQTMTIGAVPVTIVSDLPPTPRAPAPEPAAEPAVEPEPAAEPEPEPEPAPPTPAPPPPKAAAPPPTPAPKKAQPLPTPAPKKAPTPAPIPAPKKAPTPPQKAPPQKAPPLKARPEDDGLDLGKLAESLKRTPARPAGPPAAAKQSPAGGRVTPAGQAALGAIAAKIEERWEFSCEIVRDADVRVSFTLNSSGAIVSGPRLVDPKPGAAWQTAARAALAAVRDAEPYSGLPTELYNVELRPNLRASQACAGR